MAKEKFEWLGLMDGHGYREKRHSEDEIVRRRYLIRSFAELEELISYPSSSGDMRVLPEAECDRYFNMDRRDDRVKLLLRHRIILPLLRKEIAINRDKYEDVLDEIVYETTVLVYEGKDVIVSKDYPLIINDQSACTFFGKVTIKAGGYIAIRTNCVLRCDSIVAEKSDETDENGKIDKADQEGHIRVIGADGTPGRHGEDGIKVEKAANGSGGTCDCCGGIAHDDAKNGSDGTRGNDGTPGEAGTNGAKPMDLVQIRITDLLSDLYIYNAGGKGGDGGKGGNGGNGGEGGDGGSGKVCGAEVGKSGSGGSGGTGGNGANGGKGGDGGKGSAVMVSVESANGHKVFEINVQSCGGTGGNPGANGAGGLGGKSGGSGGSAGNKGAGGTGTPVKGADGQKGDFGSITIEYR